MSNKDKTTAADSVLANALEQAAAQAAAAPVTEQANTLRDALRAALPGNRYAGLLEGFQFHTSANGKTYTNTDGSSSKKIAAGIIIYNGGFACSPLKVYAKRQGQAGRITADVSFVGQRDVQAIMPLDEKSKGEIAALKAYLSGEFVKWYKAQGVDAAPPANPMAELDGVGDLFKAE
jgi:hypothetical protein